MNERQNQSRKSAFAIMEDLRDPLAGEGLSDSHVWDYLKQYYNVDSRSDFPRTAWVTIAVRLNMCKRDENLFESLIRKVWRYHLTLDWQTNRLHLLL